MRLALSERSPLAGAGEPSAAPTRGRTRTIVATAIACLLACAGSVATADDGDAATDDAARAIALYDAGNYAGSLELLERLDAGRTLDGSMLYRLAFARGRVGNTSGAREAAARAIAALESEVAETAKAPSLESWFYLSNAYRNERRNADSRRVAKEATDRIDRGDAPKPTGALGMFRLGKLYQDQGRHDEVATWFGRALEAMDREPDRYVGYRRWARRHLGNLAYARSDFAGSVEHFSALVGIEPPAPTDHDLLATAQARLGDFASAVEGWKTAERLDPAKGDRARYCGRLAALALASPAVASKAPDGRSLRELDRETLETLMKAHADVVLNARKEVEEATAAGQSVTEERIAELQTAIDSARPIFVGAALEYALRRYPIRETAFFGGYAPLIFHATRWKL